MRIINPPLIYPMNSPRAKTPLEVRRDDFAKNLNKDTVKINGPRVRKLSSFGDEALKLLKKIEEFEAKSLESKIRVK